MRCCRKSVYRMKFLLLACCIQQVQRIGQMTILMSSLLGLMIFLLAAMDHPFRGELSVGPVPFEMVYEQIMKPIPEGGDTR